MKPVLELLPDFVLGALPGDEQRHVQELIDGSPKLQREVDRVSEALALTAEQVAPVPPPPTLRARLLATLDGADRFAPFLDELARLFELPIATIRALLARIDGSEWETTLLGVPLRGCELFHFPVGPRLRATGAAGGVVRVRAGVTFPRHRHHGDEVTFVLEGGYVADDLIYGPGEQVPMATGTAHSYTAAPERDLVMIVLHRGITLLDV